MYRTLHHSLPWIEKSEWCWPEYDRQLLRVFHQVADIDVIIKYVDQMGVCIQAGGACGIWPLRFSQLFETVYTFEPKVENYHCLMENIQGSGIIAFHNPLSDKNEKYNVVNDDGEADNCGAGYLVQDSDGVEAIKIDDLGLGACDLIQLDVEGYELEALQGAIETIKEYKPTIVLEEKPLPHINSDYKRARKWLSDMFGYRVVDGVSKDIILKA